MLLRKKAIRLIEIILPLLISAAVLMTGCSAEKPTPQPASAPEYTVTFAYGGEALERQETPAGGTAQAPEPELPEELVLAGWLDESGELVRPEETPIDTERVFTAYIKPRLFGDAEYLFPDSHGLIRAEDPISGAELSQAFYCLSGEAAWELYPALYEDEDSVTAGMLRTVLEHFAFDIETDEALEGYADGAILTRADFAAIMNRVTGRTERGDIVPQHGLALFPDLAPEQGEELYEAAAPHSHAENGKPWTEIALKSLYEPGFVNIDGALYSVGEDGLFERDVTVGTLEFGSDGRQTSGNEELDEYVRCTLNDITAEYPSGDRLEMLRAAYEYARDNFTYLRKNGYALGQTGWAADDALEMFKTGRGNCYNYAGAFWALARGLGFEAETISGTITATDQPHGWVEIVTEGERYICDPEFEMAYHERDIYKYDMFMLPIDKVAYWHYGHP